MLILALESSTETASCALWREGEVYERRSPPGSASSATLLPEIAALLAEQSLLLADVDAIAFGAGPGSFTGLRVACALAQGLAYAAGRPVVAVSTFAAIAAAAGEPRVLAVVDARMGEVYFGRVDRRGEDWVAVGDAGVASPQQVPLPEPGVSICGNALAAYPELRERCAAASRLRPEVLPSAAAVARVARRILLAGGAMTPAEALPIYVRDKVAQTVAERVANGGRA